jgi:SAM-dependent methyltransferase
MPSNSEHYWDSDESLSLYDAAPFLFQGEQLAFAAIAGNITGHSVLDLACGAGRTTHYLHQMGARVIGVDIAANLLEAARRRFPEIDFRLGDATALSFPDESFDVVLVSFNSFDCLYPKERRLKSLREVWRVLRPNGQLVFSHHNSAALFFGWYRFLRPAKLAYRLRHILNGDAFRPECYLPEFNVPGMKTYFARPRQVTADLGRAGFERLAVFPNDPLLGKLQKVLHMDTLTRLAEPWPYYVCQKEKLQRGVKSG